MTGTVAAPGLAPMPLRVIPVGDDLWTGGANAGQMSLNQATTATTPNGVFNY